MAKKAAKASKKRRTSKKTSKKRTAKRTTSKRKAAKPATKRSAKHPMDIAIAVLKRNPKASYADVQAAGAKQGVKVAAPIVMRHARNKLGISQPAARKAARKTAKKTASSGSGERAATVAFAAKHMKKKPDITMSDLQKLAGKKHNIYPLILGLARKELGWGRPKKKTAAKRAPGRPPKTAGRRGPGRPRKTTGRRGPGRPRKTSDPADAISAVVNRMRDLERETDSLRKALDKIAGIASAV